MVIKYREDLVSSGVQSILKSNPLSRITIDTKHINEIHTVPQDIRERIDTLVVDHRYIDQILPYLPNLKYYRECAYAPYKSPANLELEIAFIWYLHSAIDCGVLSIRFKAKKFYLYMRGPISEIKYPTGIEVLYLDIDSGTRKALYEKGDSPIFDLPSTVKKLVTNFTEPWSVYKYFSLNELEELVLSYEHPRKKKIWCIPAILLPKSLKKLTLITTQEVVIDKFHLHSQSTTLKFNKFIIEYQYK
jgi:hypothetical protein